MNKESKKKFEIQNSQYFEPYHYYVNIDQFRQHKVLTWGLEYYSYINCLKNYISNLSFKNMLDVGCGDGVLINYLSNKFCNSNYVGIDLSDKAIAFANAYKNNKNVIFQCVELKNIKQKFDLITLIETLEHIPDHFIKPLIVEIKKKINKNGVLLVSVPSVNLAITKKHYRHYSLDILNEQLGTFFELDHMQYVYNGTSVLLRIMKKILNNRLFILNSQLLIKFILRVIKNRLYNVKKKKGFHIVALYKLK